jgi:hypothetical protein
MSLRKDNWGNQELPGISNDELLSEEFYKKFVNAETAARNKLLAQDPTWRALVKAGVERRNSDPIYKKIMEDMYSSEEYKFLRRSIGKQLKEDAEWQKKHNEGIQNFLNDKEKVKVWKQNVEAKRHLTTEAKYKSYTTPDGVFPSLMEAAKFYSISGPSLKSRAKFKPDQYYFTEEGPGKKRAKKVRPLVSNRGKLFFTPVGVFKSLKEAAVSYKVDTSTMAKWKDKKPTEYYFIED